MHNPYAAPQAGLDLPFAPATEARLLCWNERIGRVRFLAYSLLGIPLAILFGVLTGIVIGVFGWQAYFSSGRAQALGAVVLMIPLLVLAAAARRRVHDVDLSSWWVLVLLFPILQFIFLVYLMVARGTPAANRFGVPPPPPGFGLKLGVVIGCALPFGFIALRFL
ncbi:DUF805 domain-containing protein [Duganella sp. Root1480D1]|uniref:DUF805 domain-containing protein n=1 Tax=Duganella sp. Root1480D1 TaxID=1736471 RepID=UPI00070DE8A8|nr:DUF805 domain-containing protein [Duganella sp. Root1480D1]KQZ27529.1 hypothetical protein ASD58_13030 [Duganella sp. Root1480D1]